MNSTDYANAIIAAYLRGVADGDTEAPEHREHVATQERPYSRAAEDAQARSDAEAIGSLISLDDLVLRHDTIIAAPGTFEWAVCQLKRGKTVRRKGWPEGWTVCIRGGVVHRAQGEIMGPFPPFDSHGVMLATDWEIAP